MGKMTEEARLKQIEWRKNNRDKYLEYAKVTNENRRKKINSDPEYFLTHTYSSLKSGAFARGYAFNLSKKQLKKLLETKNCQLSGRPLVQQTHNVNKISIDRIDNRYGYSVKNVQVVSAEVNKHRLDLSVNDFIKLCVDVAVHNGYVLAK